MAAGGSTKVILASLGANMAIAIAKGTAAFFTKSGAMLAESIHSLADCTNQVFLLIGAKEAKKGPDETHPLGRGRAAYFWSFLVALMIFFGGGVFAIYEGIHKMQHPEPVTKAWIGYLVLSAAILFEGFALTMVVREIFTKKKPPGMPLFKYLRTSKDADLVVLFAEDTAACVGLVLALIALALADVTGNGIFDAYGSIAIGVLLCVVAVWLAREVKSLLQGENADPAVKEIFREEAAKDERIAEVLRILTIQQGPGQVVLAAKLRLRKGVASNEIAHAINELEARVTERRPDVIWQFVEPDVEA